MRARAREGRLKRCAAEMKSELLRTELSLSLSRPGATSSSLSLSLSVSLRRHAHTSRSTRALSHPS